MFVPDSVGIYPIYASALIRFKFLFMTPYRSSKEVPCSGSMALSQNRNFQDTLL